MKLILPLAVFIVIAVPAHAADDPACLEEDSGGPLENCLVDSRTGDLRPAIPVKTHIAAPCPTADRKRRS